VASYTAGKASPSPVHKIMQVYHRSRWKNRS